MPKKQIMLSVIKANASNVDIIAPLFDLYRQFYEQTSDLHGAKAFLKERLEQNESVVFIAYWNDQPVGFTQLYPVFSSVSMCRSWVLNDLYVLADFRKHGVGNALLETAKVHGRNTAANGLLLETADDNFVAQSLYEKNGWTREKHFFYWYHL